MGGKGSLGARNGLARGGWEWVGVWDSLAGRLEAEELGMRSKMKNHDNRQGNAAFRTQSD